MNRHLYIDRACRQAVVVAMLLSGLATTAGRISDALYRLAERRLRHAQALADLAQVSVRRPRARGS